MIFQNIANNCKLKTAQFCSIGRPGRLSVAGGGALLLHLVACGGGTEETPVDPSTSSDASELVVLRTERLEAAGVPHASARAADATTSAAVPHDGLVPGPRLDQELNAQRALIQPASSGWVSEQLSDRAARQLAQLKEAFAAAGADERIIALAELLSGDCQSSRLVPEPASAEAPGQRFQTLRDTPPLPDSDPLVGRDHVAAELHRWGKRFSQQRLGFKVVRIVPGEPGQFETTVLASGDGTDGIARSQETARWRVRWQSPQPDRDRPPLICEIALEHAEVSGFEFDGGTLYRDQTAAAMAPVAAYPRQYLQGNNHWARVIPLAEGGALLGYNGLAIGDADGDGLDDVYIPDGGSLPNRLLFHQADGTLEDRSVEAGVDWLDLTISALLIDLDNDGDQDLVSASPPFVLFMENDGSGKFAFRGAHRSATNPYSLVAADYDGDRLLDLYLCNYSGAGAGGSAGSGTIAAYPQPYSDANNGAPNVLLKNLGAFAFRDATAETGLDQNNTRFSQAAAWEDYDGDGDPDLYVANDFGRNNLYRNDGGQRFVDVAAAAGVEDQASGMSVTWGDYDRDGQADLYVSNMFSSAGNRVTYQARFENGRDGDDVALTRRMARGNSLFRARGAGEFDDVSEAAGVAMARWAWGSLFADLNNDGWEDLVVANGYLSNDRADDL